jgi:hypothetical protein
MIVSDDISIAQKPNPLAEDKVFHIGSNEDTLFLNKTPFNRLKH